MAPGPLAGSLSWHRQLTFSVVAAGRQRSQR